MDGGHVPFEIVQTKVFKPMLKPLTPGVADVVDVKVPVPAVIVQSPDPTIGIFPFKTEAVEQIVESNPAFATVGVGSIVMSTASLDAGHVPFEIVQTKVFTPTLSPVTPEVPKLGVVTVPLPAVTVQLPVPTTAVFPFKVVDDEHNVTSLPAAATVGFWSTLIVMSSADGAQVPFDMVHLNVFTPILNPVTPDVGDVGVVTAPEPAITVHAPVPVTGVFPANVEDDEHSVWSAPAVAVVGGVSRKIVMSSVDGVQMLFEMVHLNVLVPKLNPVIPEVGDVGVVTVADPAITVQAPVPTPGVFPANVAVVVQSV